MPTTARVSGVHLISYRRQDSNICVISTIALASTYTNEPVGLPTAIAFVSRCKIKTAIRCIPLPRASSINYANSDSLFPVQRPQSKNCGLTRWYCYSNGIAGLRAIIPIIMCFAPFINRYIILFYYPFLNSFYAFYVS